MPTLRIRTWPGFSVKLSSWEAVLSEDGALLIEAAWHDAGHRKTAEQVSEIGKKKAQRVLSELSRLIPVGTTQVYEFDDVGGYDLEIETELGVQKWVDAGVLSYSRQDKTTQAINDIFRSIEAEVLHHLKPLGYPDSRARKRKHK
ncbi:MAG: hypothetical protein KDB90_07165 [Planctomycetes bacterium]|nr:hypothetical protein [Planctomycetota bacterium]